MALAYINVSAFIDWNSQLLLTGVKVVADPVVAADLALQKLARRISTTLSSIEHDLLFKVNFRFYHGWHKGFEETVNRKAMKTIIAQTDFSTLSPRRNVVFNAEIGYGDCLISALPYRMHTRPAIHLPNTLRDKISGSGVEEKMVDTALATDVVVTAYAEPEGWILVATEDDDIVPSLFSAEAAINRKGSRVILMSERKRSKNFLKLENIVV
jgi:uncharacterized LabA/DUF88 family protein